MLRTVEQQTMTPSSTTYSFGSSKWLPKQTSEEKCQQRLLQKLIEMKKQNVLRRCFLSESNEFEVLEFYGDAYLYERVSYFIMTTRRFMDPNLMTKLRCSCIKNANLATVFEQLKLAELLEPSPLGLTLKSKADILEAIIGELAEDSSSGAEDLLSALIAYIAYMGDKEYFQEANAGVVSLGEGMTTTPKKTKARRRQRSHKDSGNNNHNPNTRID
jgi:dsRNA-specific ribonuclease